MSQKSALYLCLRGRLARWVSVALVAAGLCGPLAARPAPAQQAPLTLKGPAGETNVVADRIQQVGGESDLYLATGQSPRG